MSVIQWMMDPVIRKKLGRRMERRDKERKWSSERVWRLEVVVGMCGELVREGECWNRLLICISDVAHVLAERGGAEERLRRSETYASSSTAFCQNKYNTQKYI